MLPIDQVINNNTLRWFDHVMRREEELTQRVVMNEVKDEGKDTKRKTKTNVARHPR